MPENKGIPEYAVEIEIFGVLVTAADPGRHAGDCFTIGENEMPSDFCVMGDRGPLRRD
jgi:hypothetical protein